MHGRFDFENGTQCNGGSARCSKDDLEVMVKWSNCAVLKSPPNYRTPLVTILRSGVLITDIMNKLTMETEPYNKANCPIQQRDRL